MRKILLLAFLLLLLTAGDYPEYPCGHDWMVALDDTYPFTFEREDFTVAKIAVQTKENSCFWITRTSRTTGCYVARWSDPGDPYWVRVETVNMPSPNCQEIAHVEWYALENVLFFPVINR